MDLGTPPLAPAEPPPIFPVAALVATLLWGFVGLGTLGMLTMSAMMFDAPGSENNPYLWGIVGSLAATAVLCLTSVVGGWIALGVTGRWGTARARAGRTVRLILALLPLAGVAGVVIGFVLLQVACKGSFSCR